MTFIKTVDELRAAMAHAPGSTPVLLFLHDPPRAGWLGTVRYDPSSHTLDLHSTSAVVDVTAPPLPAVTPSPHRRPTQVVNCPTCRAQNVEVEWIGATARYAQHWRPQTHIECGTGGAGIGNRQLDAARTVQETP